MERMTSRRRNVSIEATFAITRLIDWLDVGNSSAGRWQLPSRGKLRKADSYTLTMARIWPQSSLLALFLPICAGLGVSDGPDVARAWARVASGVSTLASSTPTTAPLQPATTPPVEIVGLPTAGATHVQVRLWVGDRLVGRGEGDGSVPAGSTGGSTPDALATALEGALDSARSHSLIQAIAQAGGDPSQSVRPELTIAHLPEELMVTEWGHIDGKYAIGLDALWLLVDGRLAWSFPMEQLQLDAANGTGTMLRLAAGLDLRAGTLADSRKHHDIRVGRAAATRLVATEPGEPPTAVMRRHAMRLPTSVESAKESARAVARFIAASAPSASLVQDPDLRTSIEAVGLSDHFELAAGRFRNVNASPAAQALAAWSLLEASPLLDEKGRAEALRTARAALQSLPRRAVGEGDAAASRLAGAVAVATMAGPDGARLELDGDTSAWIDQARARLTETIDSDTPPIDESRAPEVYAYAVAAAGVADETALARARAAIARAWDELPPSLIPSAAAWLIMAERAIDPMGTAPAIRGETSDRAVALLCSMQLDDPGAGARQFDLVGGILGGAPPIDPRGSARVGATSALPTMAIALSKAPRVRIAAAMGFLTILPIDSAGAVGGALGSGSFDPTGAVGEWPWSPRSELGHAALVLRALTTCIQALESDPKSLLRLDSAPVGDTLHPVGPDEEDR